MKTSLVSSVAGLVLLLSLCISNGQEVSSGRLASGAPLQVRPGLEAMREELRALMARHGVSAREVIDLLSDDNPEIPCFPVGGLGNVVSGIMVDTDRSKDRILLNGKWLDLGPATAKGRMVVVSTNGLIAEWAAGDAKGDAVTFILYEGDRIRFRSWTGDKASYYLRSSRPK
jgi:hypothetical protein